MSISRHGAIVLLFVSILGCASDPAAPKSPGTGGAGSDDSDDEKGQSSSPAKGTDAGPRGIDAGPARQIDAGQGRTSDGNKDAAVKTDASTPIVVDVDASTAPVVGTESAFQACTKTLKAPCAYDDKETSCASLLTPVIPLTAGGTFGGTELKGGPYGAYVEWNEGAAFKNPTSLAEGTCDILAGSFGEPAATTADILNLRGQDLALYTVFRPACTKEGEKYPVITWGNGTCGQSGGYAALLATVASHGFVVIAANSRFTDGGNKEMLRALDLAKAINEDPKNVLYQKLDLEKVGAMGHSQGGAATAHAATDPRIKALILWNGGVSSTVAKPFLAVSGDRDIGDQTVMGLSSTVNGATQPAAWLFYHKVLETGGSVTGHLTLMEQPGRVTDVTVAWWKYMLLGDAEAKKTFVGTDCTLCNNKAEYEYGQHNLK
jgi:pimeloyl-ACP methyl ester carboxylesterase